MVILAVFILAWAPLPAAAQGDLHFGEVKKLDTRINSPCEEVLPLAAPGGGTLYFVRTSCPENTGGQFTGSDIWVSRFDTARLVWERPVNTKEVFNDKDNNAIAGIHTDGNTIYQLNTATTPANRVRGLYISKKTGNDSWTRPELVPAPFLKSEQFLGVYVSPAFDIMLISMAGPDSRGKEDLYASFKDAKGEWSEPRHLGAVINTAGFEISPFLSPDRKRLYFASSGHEGLGDADIFYSDRLDDTWQNWSAPVNLGDRINSDKFDAYFTLRDSVAYFSSNRDSRFSDIYRAALQAPARTDSTEQQIEKIVAEATSILADLESDESTYAAAGSIFIDFPDNSSAMSTEATDRLDGVVDVIRNRDSRQVTLVAHSGDPGAGAQNGLWYKRLDVIRNYFERKQVPRLKIYFEMKKNTEGAGRNGTGTVEVRF